jgi:hypothetical protein
LETTATIEPPSGESPHENASSVKTPDERELSFTFGPNSDAEEDQTQDQRKTRPPERKELSVSPASKPQAASGDETAEPWSMSAPEETPEEPITMTAPHPIEAKIVDEPVVTQPNQISTEADPPSRETAENIVPINTFRDQAASTVPYLTLFGLLLIFFFLTTAYLEAHPKISETVVGKIPLIGPLVVKNNYLKDGVLLKSLRAAYQSIQGNREVLVVSGEAVNQNPVVIRELRVLGQLFNPEGKAVEQQVIWVGNALSPKIIRGMSAQDIVDLQRLKPLKSFEVPPGDSISFAIVFLRPSKEIKDFSCEVLSAEGEI